jgi:hypothetical protein
MNSNSDAKLVFVASPSANSRPAAGIAPDEVCRVKADWLVDHELKLDPEQMTEVMSGAKTHEVRRFDRDFKLGDTLLLREYSRPGNRYTGVAAFMEVTNVTQPGTYGLPSGIGVMSVAMHGSADMFSEACFLDDQFPDSPCHVSIQHGSA